MKQTSRNRKSTVLGRFLTIIGVLVVLGGIGYALTQGSVTSVENKPEGEISATSTVMEIPFMQEADSDPLQDDIEARKAEIMLQKQKEAALEAEMLVIEEEITALQNRLEEKRKEYKSLNQAY
jgi:septal ring factor EnvC (AmiA/AmiB activator)